MLNNDTIYIKVSQTTFAVKLDSIIYMEKRRRQIIVHMADADDICFYGKYDAVMPFLDRRFAHPHQSYVINMEMIFRLGNQEVVLLGGSRIRMGTKCFACMKKAYDAFVAERIGCMRADR